jgi:SAM-dependent methyltransferase
MKEANSLEEILADTIRLQEQDPKCQLVLFESLVSANQYRRLYRTIRKNLSPGARVLDWGCGQGHLSYGLEKLGYRVDGYSFEDFHLRRYLSSSYQFVGGNYDPVSIPFPDERFDAVVSCGVLEHVRETGGTELASLKEIWRILKPNGCFICYHLPNRFSLIERLNVLLNRSHYHPYRFTKNSILTLCLQSGFTLQDVYRYGMLPRNSWNRFPPSLRNRRSVAEGYDLIDNLLRHPLSLICQNYLFVAKKT